MKRTFYLFSITAALCLYTGAAWQKGLTTSVVIPCVPKHLPYVYKLLLHYKDQTLRPYEIIIALSEKKETDKQLRKIIEKKEWPFKVVIKATSKKQRAGENRNRGARAARGDIIIFQEADDIPHPQLIEIVTHLFTNHKIVHLLYQWIPHPFWLTIPDSIQNFIPYNKELITTEPLLDPEQLITRRLTNGQPCVLRTALRTVAWPTEINIGEDIEFNRRMMNHFPRQSLIVHAYLSIYNKQRSSYHTRYL